MKPVVALPLEQAVRQQLMPAFSGLTPSAGILATLRQHPIGGLTLFRALNVADLRARLAEVDLVVIGTINATAHAGQAALVNALPHAGTPTVAVALRLPYDPRRADLALFSAAWQVRATLIGSRRIYERADAWA